MAQPHGTAAELAEQCPAVTAAAADAAAPAREEIDGAVFARQPVTALLREAIETVAGVLRDALGDRALVEISRPLTVSAQTRLVPDLSISWRIGQQVPDVVMEMRTESTDRFALGPKRLVYARAGVPAFYFLDPQAGVLRTMLAVPHQLDYRWPPSSQHRGESIELAGFPGVRLQVGDLLPLGLLRRTADV